MTPDFLSNVEPALASGLAGFEYLEHVVRLSGGASQETWALDAIVGGQTMPLILRRSPGGHVSPNAVRLSTEAEVIEVARRAGCAVPEVRYALKPEDGAGDGYLMARLAGETIARKILRDAAFDAMRPGLARQCGTALAHVHAINTATLPELAEHDGPAQWHRYRDLYDSYDAPHPVFEAAFKWLEPHLKPAEERKLVHGDFRLGNLLITPEGLNAVLDWELTHLGDPLEDIGWICTRSWRFGLSRNIVGGFGSLEDFLDAYAEAGGQRYSVDDVRPWIVFGSLKWGIMCMTMVQGFRLDGSVERATIGRRVSECEYDLVRMILQGEL